MNTIKIDFRSRKMTDAFDLINQYGVDSLYDTLEDFEVFLCKTANKEMIGDYAEYKSLKHFLEMDLRCLIRNNGNKKIIHNIEEKQKEMNALYQKYKLLGD